MIVQGRLRIVNYKNHEALFADLDNAWLYRHMGDQGGWQWQQASNVYDADDPRFLELTSFEIPDMLNRERLQDLIDEGIFQPFKK